MRQDDAEKQDVTSISATDGNDSTNTKPETIVVSHSDVGERWYYRAADVVLCGVLFLIFGAALSVSVLWDFVRTRAMWVSEMFFPHPPPSLVDGERTPKWIYQERARRGTEESAIKEANPGTIISCHNCPFRIYEDTHVGPTRPMDGLSSLGSWENPEERDAVLHAADRWRSKHTVVPVCAHPANGKWGAVRFGAHTPDAETCPRAIMANMNPVSRVYWAWRMKQHIKKYGISRRVL